MITHVIWDWNGTLYDDVAAAMGATEDLLRAWNLPPLGGVERYHALFRFPVVDYYRDLGFTLEQFPAAAVGYTTRFASGRWRSQLRPDALGTVRRLAGHGIVQAVVSAADQGDLEDQMAPFPDLRRLLVGALGQADIYAHSKVETARRWLADEGVAPGSVLFVGDTEHDAEVAEAVGAASVLFTGGHASRERLEQTGRPVLDRLSDVLGYLER